MKRRLASSLHTSHHKEAQVSSGTLLDGSVKLVMVQVSFSNPNVLPKWIDVDEKEQPEERVERKVRANGTMIIEPVEDMNCSLDQFVSDLEEAGFALVSAICQKRPHGKQKGQFYWMARFVFVRQEDLQANEGFDRVKHLIYAELRNIFREALWRVRAFRNPFFKDEEEVAGAASLSINCEARKPLRVIEQNRPPRPAMEWLKDENGQKIGDGPVAVKAKCHLRVQDGEVRLVKA